MTTPNRYDFAAYRLRQQLADAHEEKLVALFERDDRSRKTARHREQLITDIDAARRSAPPKRRRPRRTAA